MVVVVVVCLCCVVCVCRMNFILHTWFGLYQSNSVSGGMRLSHRALSNNDAFRVCGLARLGLQGLSFFFVFVIRFLVWMSGAFTPFGTSLGGMHQPGSRRKKISHRRIFVLSVWNATPQLVSLSLPRTDGSRCGRCCRATAVCRGRKASY